MSIVSEKFNNGQGIIIFTIFQVHGKFQREYSITMLVESIKLLKQPPTCTFINEEIISYLYDAHITTTYTVKPE